MHTNVRDVRDVMSGMYGQWCVVLNISTFGGQLIKFISFKNLCSILKDYKKKCFSIFTSLRSISDLEMSGMFGM